MGNNRETKDFNTEKRQINSDYYVENGLFIFTENYHLKRGYCCENGCRHCPYGNKSKSKAKTS